MKKVFWLFLILFLISCRRVSEDVINKVEINLSNLIKEGTVTVGGVDEGFEIPVVLAEKSIQAWLIPIDDKPKDLAYFVESIDKTKVTSNGGKLILESPVKEGKYYLYTVDSQGRIEKNGDNIITVDRKPMVEVVKDSVDGTSELPTWNIKAKEYKKNNEKPVKYKVVVKEAGKALHTDEEFKGTQFVYKPTSKNGLFEIEVEAYYKSFENIEKSDKLNPKKENIVWSTKNFGGKIQVGDSNLNKPTIDTPAPTTPALPGEIKLPVVSGTSYKYTFKPVAETVDAEQVPLVKSELTRVSAAQEGNSYTPPIGLKDGEYLFEVKAIKNGQESEATIVKYVVTSTPTATVSVTGETTVGKQLTANLVFTDEAGDLEGATTYQWYRGTEKIDKATGSMYTLTKADKAHPISVKVTPVAKTGNPKVGVEVSSTPSVIVGVSQEGKPEVQADDVNNYLDKKDGNKYEGTDLEYLDQVDNKWKTYNPSKPPIEWTGDIEVEIRKAGTDITDPSDSVLVRFTKLNQNKPEIDRDDIANVITSVKSGMVYYDGTTWQPLTDKRLFPGEQIVRVKYAETPTHKESEEVSVIFTRPKAPDATKDDINNILIDSKGNKLVTSGLEYRIHSGEDAWQAYDPTTAKFDGAVLVEIRVAEKIVNGILQETAGESTTISFTDNSKPTKPVVVTNPGDKDSDPTTVGPALPLKPETITWPVGGVPTGTIYEYTFRPVNVFDNQIQSSGVARELAKVANPQKGTSYTPISGLRDGEYVLEIVATKDGVKSEATKVTYTVESAPTVNPEIIGVAKEGVTLLAVLNYSDEAEDKIDTANTAYEWLVGGVVKGDSPTFLILKEYEGQKVEVRVTPHALTGKEKIGKSVTSASITVQKVAPDKPVVPDIDKDGNPDGIGPKTPLDGGTVDLPAVKPSGVKEYEYTFIAKNLYGNPMVTFPMQKGDKFVVPPFLNDGDYELTIVAVGTNGTKSDSVVVPYTVKSTPTVKVTIPATSKTGDLLKASTIFEDLGKDKEGTLKYRWFVDGVDTGLKTSTLTVTAVMEGKDITVEVTPVSQTGNPREGTPVLSGVSKVEPIKTVIDSINKNDTSITWASSGQPDGVLEYKYSFREVSIVDGQMNTIKLPIAGKGTIFFVPDGLRDGQYQIDVVAVGKNGIESTVTTAYYYVELGPTIKTVTISGLTKVGGVLKAQIEGFDDKSGDAFGSYKYQWYADGIAIKDAISESYKLTKNELNKVISLKVTPVSQTGNPRDGIPVESNKSNSITIDKATMPLLKADDDNDYVALASNGQLLNMSGLEYRTSNQIGSVYLPYDSTLRFAEDVTVEIRVKETSISEASDSQMIKFTKKIVYDEKTLKEIVNRVLEGTGNIYRRSAGDIVLNAAEIEKHMDSKGELPFTLWIAHTKGSEYIGETEKSSKFKFEKRDGKYVIDAPITGGGQQYMLVIQYNGNQYENTNRKIVVINQPTEIGPFANKLSGKAGTQKEILGYEITNNEQEPKIKQIWIAPSSFESKRNTTITNDYLGGERDLQFEYEFVSDNSETMVSIMAQSGVTTRITLPKKAGKYRAYIIDNAGNVSPASAEFTVTN